MQSNAEYYLNALMTKTEHQYCTYSIKLAVSSIKQPQFTKNDLIISNLWKL